MIKKFIVATILTIVAMSSVYGALPPPSPGNYDATFYCLPTLIRSLDGTTWQPTPVNIGNFFLNPGAIYTVAAPMGFWLHGPHASWYTVSALFNSNPDDFTDVILDAEWDLSYEVGGSPYTENLHHGGNWTRTNLHLIADPANDCQSWAKFIITTIDIKIPTAFSHGFAANLGQKWWTVTVSATAFI